MGPKIGFNGVNNAGLAFNQVRVPRTELLNRCIDVLLSDGLCKSSEVKFKETFLICKNNQNPWTNLPNKELPDLQSTYC